MRFHHLLAFACFKVSTPSAQITPFTLMRKKIWAPLLCTVFAIGNTVLVNFASAQTTPPAPQAAANPASANQTSRPASAATGALAGAKSAAQTLAVNPNPRWVNLTAQQKAALAPLITEWDKMEELRKKKWLGIADKYAAMKPEEQARMHERMSAWVKLTPEQRMEARENFTKSTQIKPEQKSARWQQYQQLTEEQKKLLAEEASRKKSITNLPPASQLGVKPLAPIKAGPPSTPKSTLILPPASKILPAGATSNVTPAAPSNAASSLTPNTPNSTSATSASSSPVVTTAAEKVEK